MLINGDFSSENGWVAHAGLDLVYEQVDNVSFARIGSRTENWHGMYQDITISLDPNQVRNNSITQ